MGRPRLDIDETAITQAYANGATISSLAAAHGVDRYVVRRVLTEADNIVDFPRKDGIDVPPGHVTSAELLDRARITFRQLDYWCRTGYLQPANGSEPGSGNPRIFPRSEIQVAALMTRLLEAGLTPRVAHRLSRELLEHGHADLAGIRIDLPQDL